MSYFKMNSKIHLDEMTKRLRLVNPDEHHLSRNILELSDELQQEGDNFTKRVADISELMDKMSNLVNEAKMEVIGRRCHLFMAINLRQAAEKSYQAEIYEKNAQLERNQLYIESLGRHLHEQTELLTRIFRK